MFKSVLVLFVLGLMALCQATPCVEQRSKQLLSQKQGLIGAFLVQCETDGSFKARQCHASTGYCFCVNENGTKISSPSRTLRACECVRKNYAVVQKNLIGAYAPQCNGDGTYSTRQCYASTGQCWCVAADGTTISNGTFGLSSCDCYSQKYTAVKQGLLGSFRPQCEKDGSFSAMQSHEGYNWCASPDGTRITNKTRDLKSCQCVLHKYTAVQEGLLGSFRPNCDANGYYSVMQCHEHSCWCSRRNGEKLPVVAKDEATCKCYRQADDIIATGLGISLPSCA